MNTAGVQEVHDDNLDQACAWVARLRADNVSAADRRNFAAWLSESTANRDAFDEISELWGDLGALAHMPIDELFPESRNPNMDTASGEDARATSSWDFAQWLMGGGLAAACLVATLWLGSQWLGSQPQREQVYATNIGETRTVTLVDGSRVTLNTNSELHVSFSREQRHTQLLRGEAYFEVTRQTSRPFTVAAGSANIRVLGTEFNIERNTDNTRVSVTGGTVAVSEAKPASGLQPESVKLVKNQKISVSRTGLQPVRSTSADEALDWTRGVLVFEQTPLHEALEELNRYLKVPAAADPSVGERKLSGTFELSDPDNTLKAIASALNLEQIDSDPNLTLLSPKPN